MEELRLAFLGFGSANRTLARMLLEKSETSSSSLSSPSGSGRHFLPIPIAAGGSSSTTRLVPWRVVCIVTRRHGRVCVPSATLEEDNGVWSINLREALRCVESGHMLDHSVFFQEQISEDNKTTTHGDVIVDALADADHTMTLLANLGKSQTANIVVEAIPSNPKGDGEPAISFITTALQSKMHVVSANKSSLAHCNVDNGEETYWGLQQLASDNNVMYKHESAVMDGVPIFSLWGYTLPCAKLTSIRGCLNSTTTMILTRMEGINLDDSGTSNESGDSFEDALNAAKEMGIVEEDESLDVDGYDAAVKLRALLVVLTRSFNGCNNEQVRIPTMDEIYRDSIRNVTREDIRQAYGNGRKKYRLVASANLVDSPRSNEDQDKSLVDCNGVTKEWHASVELQLLPPSDPLYNLTGSDASVQFSTDVLGPVTVVSSNPTLVDTAYGLFADIVRVASESTS